MSYYGARWYDPQLGRFIQPDTIVPNPGNAQAFDRYAYTLNNPLLYSDPDGHAPCMATAGKCRQPVDLTNQSADQMANHLSDLNVDWADIPVNVRLAFQAEGMHEGIYTDLHGNAQVQTGLLDPATFAASAFGIGRLVLRLPALLFSCADDGCETEYRTYEMAVRRVDSVVSFQKMGGFSRDVLTIGYHLNSEVGEVSLLPQRLANGTIQIAVTPSGSTTGTITNNIVNGVTELLQSDPTGALQRARGIISSFSSDPRYAERVKQAQLLIEAFTTGNYSVVK